jgi:hypothetical protein
MHSMKRGGSIAVVFAAVLFLAPVGAPAQDMVVGVNVVNPCAPVWPIRMLSSGS